MRALDVEIADIVIIHPRKTYKSRVRHRAYLGPREQIGGELAP